MRLIAEHVDVEELGDVAASPRVVLGAERVAYLRALFLYHFALLGGGARRTNLTDEIAQTLRRRRELDAELVERLDHLCDENRERITSHRIATTNLTSGGGGGGGQLTLFSSDSSTCMMGLYQLMISCGFLMTMSLLRFSSRFVC